jgi:hypothetical protein
MALCVDSRMFGLLFGALVLAGCQTTVHKDIWPRNDGSVVRAEAPKDSGLPAARAASYGEVKIGAVLRREYEFGQFTEGVYVRDQAPEVELEPLDLDLLIRLDGDPDAGFDEFDIYRGYRPLNVPDDMGVLLRFHKLNYIGKEPKVTVSHTLFGDPTKPYVTADVYWEYSIAGREWAEGQKWYILTRIRTRIQSDHPGWAASNTKIIIEDSRGFTLGAPVYERTPE